jgi:hypothetical protein
MPSNWLYVDTNFPVFTGEESTDDKVSTIQNYVFMLVEQLRYTLRNLDLRNMNQPAVKKFSNYLTEPIYGRIENAEGDITQLAVTAQGIAVRVTNAEGNITTLQITANGLQSQVSAVDGRVTTLKQTVDGFSLTASNGENFSYIYLTSRGINFGSAKIEFTGVVTFKDLSTSGRTTINGGNITTGTIRAIDISGVYISASNISGTNINGGTVTGATLRCVSGQDTGLEIYYGSTAARYLVGGIRFDSKGAGTSTEARSRMFIYTQSTSYADWAMKLVSAGGMSLTSGELIYIEANWDLYLHADDYIHMKAKKILIEGADVKINGVKY